jgi:diaminohydroxyphosphoribosylaminopyrimidine deaminase/5-amino-6-(5-phosphoribosylamino)uracil reductase
MRLALRLARRGRGLTSPNPIVGAVLVRNGRIIGRGWHRRAGQPHAEIEALQDARRKGTYTRGATLYVTLEPCCTTGRTPPCTQAIISAGIKRVVVGATDPNPKHAGKAFGILRRAGIDVQTGILGKECSEANAAFNHWIVRRTPFVIVKAAMTLDGKIATAAGESRWITGEKARAYGMKLRLQSDAILVGINTVLADNPKLTVRGAAHQSRGSESKPIRRIVLDSVARTPLNANVVADEHASRTTLVVSKRAPKARVQPLARKVNVLVALERSIPIGWVLKQLGRMEVTSLLVEGGGEVNASFLLGGFAQRVAFFYAPKILGGQNSKPGVGGEGVSRAAQVLKLHNLVWRRLGDDWLLEARIAQE